MTAGTKPQSVDRMGVPWNSDYSASTRKPKPSFVTVLTDVVGDPGRNDGALIPFGAVLDSVDLCAGRTAFSHVEGPVVTVSIEYGRMCGRVEQGDYIRVQSRVVDVGSSSITLETVLSREVLSKNPAAPPVFETAMTFQLTFVAVSAETGRPYKNVPRLTALDTEALHRSERAKNVKSIVREIEQDLVGKLSDNNPEPSGLAPWTRKLDPFHDQRTCWTRIGNTVVLFSKQYLPRHENFAGIVFGGDLLLMLESAAVYCAKRFTRAQHVQCIAMYGVTFKLPIKATHMLTSTARVVNVRQYCMEIEVIVNKCHEQEGPERSHVAYFTVVTHDGIGRMLRVSVGLCLEGASEDARHAHESAKIRIEKASWIPEETAELPHMLLSTRQPDP